MSDEHGWPEFHDPGHHDDPGHHHGYDHDPGAHAGVDHDHGWHDEVADPGHDDVAAAEVHDWQPPHHEPHDGVHEPHDVPGLHEVHDTGPAHAVVDLGHDHDMGPVGADPDATVEPGDDPSSVFPPALDVGPLPEPVDGFPWIDTGSLGVVDPVAAHAEPVTAAELAGYAAEDLPPAADPWAHLAQSEDPATSALARWWREHG